MKPGIHFGVPHATYHSLKAVSNGYLKKISEVPAAAMVIVKSTQAMIFGQAVHSFVLEGHSAFDKDFAVAPECDKRTKRGKEIYTEFVGENDGKIVITANDYDKIRLINDAVYSHPLAKKMLSDGISEVTAIWEDEETGLLCKCRPDRIPTGDRGVIIDLKTCADASEIGFQRSVTGYGYYRQAAWYIDGVNKAGGKSVDSMVFIAVEKEPPFRTEVYVLDDDFVEYGRDECRRLIRIEQECQKSNFWPHYQNPGATDIFKPSWMV